MNYYTFSIPGTYILYILITIIPPAIIGYTKRVKNKKILWILAWLILTLPAGLRYQTGVDWAGYEYAFSNIVNHGGDFLHADFNIEITFKLFTLISNTISGNSIILFLLYSGLSNLFALIGIYRFRDKVNIAWALFVYTSLLYFTQYNLGRQFLAMMILFAGTKEIIDRKFFKYCIWVIAATLCHTTAMLMVILYFMGIAIDRTHKFRKTLNIVYYVSSILVLAFLGQLTSIASVFLNNSKYDSYVSSGSYSLGAGILIQIIMLIFLFLGYRKNRCNLSNSEGLLNFSLRTFVLGNIMSLLQYSMTNFGGRISMYFMTVEILLFGAMLDGLYIKHNKVHGKYLKVLIFLFLLARAIYTIASNGQGHVPYSCYIF